MVVDKLKAVTDSFVRLQDSRHIADYHNGVEWALAESAQEVGIVRDAFQIWATIREENIAQDYLVSLLIKPRD